MATSYWYDVASGQVVSSGTRESDVWLGPFSTVEEAQEAPQTFIAHATAWLTSEDGQRYLALAQEEHGEVEGLDLDALRDLGGRS
ncbi:hypothetical protein [Nocardioides sp.]|jgi:hypothetical protein|uniref:hypothetical protein n=1 Tax=Nocardioides sp. TaxID=35761 RepID=UPI0026302AAD|nr:hypothetical protein [Nocardioides sp.]